jgi:hypothetical protein
MRAINKEGLTLWFDLQKAVVMIYTLMLLYTRRTSSSNWVSQQIDIQLQLDNTTKKLQLQLDDKTMDIQLQLDDMTMSLQLDNPHRIFSSY